MRDAHKTLGNEEAIDLIKESEAIWEKLTPCLGFSSSKTYKLFS